MPPLHVKVMEVDWGEVARIVGEEGGPEYGTMNRHNNTTLNFGS